MGNLSGTPSAPSNPATPAAPKDITANISLKPASPPKNATVPQMPPNPRVPLSPGLLNSNPASPAKPAPPAASTGKGIHFGGRRRKRTRRKQRSGRRRRKTRHRRRRKILRRRKRRTRRRRAQRGGWFGKNWLGTWGQNTKKTRFGWTSKNMKCNPYLPMQCPGGRRCVGTGWAIGPIKLQGKCI